MTTTAPFCRERAEQAARAWRGPGTRASSLSLSDQASERVFTPLFQALWWGTTRTGTVVGHMHTHSFLPRCVTCACRS